MSRIGGIDSSPQQRLIRIRPCVEQRVAGWRVVRVTPICTSNRIAELGTGSSDLHL